MTRTALILTLLTLPLAVACGDKDGDTSDGATGGGDSPCADSDYNPIAGTCVETFLAGCFDPAGECEGEVDPTTYDVTLTWDNGASVTTEVDYTNPTAPGASTSIFASDGTLCATGETKNNFGGCASQTTYTRTSDGAVQIWCIQTDGSMEIVCPGGDEVVNVTAAQSQAVNECGFSGDAGPCTVDYGY